MSREVRKGNHQKDGSFLSRWSARKNSIAKGEVVSDEKPIEVQNDLIEVDDEDAALTDEELLKKYKLLDPKEIKDEIGLSRFLEGNIPERLRQMALRRLWHLNPLFGHVCDMVEYGEDYTDAATVIEGMQTAYQVGKGYNTKPAEAEIDDMEAPASEAAENNVNENEIADKDAGGKTGAEPVAEEKKVDEDNVIERSSNVVQGKETDSSKSNDAGDLELNGYILPSDDISFLSNEDKGAETTEKVPRAQEWQASEEHGSELVAPETASLENAIASSNAPEKDKEIYARPSRMIFNQPKNNS